MGYILHVVPDSINDTRKGFVGSTKDVLGRAEYFAERGHRVRQFVSPGRSDDETLAMLRDVDLGDCQVAVFEYEMYVRSLDFLQRKYPRVRRVVRSHNANLPHFVDQFRGRLRMLQENKGTDLSQATESIHLALARFRLDRECAGLADAILPICRWEADHYWSQLTAAEKVVTVPYFVPRTLLAQIPTRPRRNVALFALGTGAAMAPLLYDAGRNAVELVNALSADVAAAWDFRITGNLKPPDILGPLGRLKSTGLLASPLPLLAEARVVVIPSDLGMGFKTKILEAILAGCWVLVTDEVHARLPDALHPWCFAMDARSPERFAEILRHCAAPPPPGDPNALLRDEAFCGLDRVLAVDRAAELAAHRIETEPGDSRPAPMSTPVRAVQPRRDPTHQGAMSVGTGRVIYHAHLKPVLVTTGLITASPAVFEYGVDRGHILKAVSEDGLTCGGVDGSPSSLDACRTGVPGATLGLVDESGTCDFPSAWADFAYAFTAIRCIPKTSRVSKAIAEMARILKPGGYVKLQVRSAPGQRPRAPVLAPPLLLNLEDRTLVLHLRPLRPCHPILRRLRLPRLGVHVHSGWKGVPLSIRYLHRVLRRHGIDPLSLEPERSQLDDVFWVTGRKGR
jgi:Methyltransferase domain/Glycosyl transferases group 1